MNTQEVVETVVKHLFEQGCRAGEMRPNSTNDGQHFFCQYRDSEGRMCAAGKMIRNEDYRIEMEGKDITSLIEDFGIEYLRPHDNALARLQSLHDTSNYWENTDRMKSGIKASLRDFPNIDLSFMSGLSFSDR